MLLLSQRQQLIVAAVLVALMVLTRGHHFAEINMLPSASWAVFLLAGIYLTAKLWFPLLLFIAAALDFSAIYWGGVSSYCVSPAYGFLLPAYGSLWLAGRWYATHYQPTLMTLFPLAITVIAATFAATLFSSGGFYWFSGRYVDPTLAEATQRIVSYFPRYLSSMGFYIAMATIVHGLFLLTKSASPHQDNKTS